MDNTSSLTSKFDKTNNDSDRIVKINEEVSITKKQFEVLKIICNTYKQSMSEYIANALIEKMQFDIEEGDFSNILLSELNEDNEGKNNSSLSSRMIEYESDNIQNALDSLVVTQE